MQDFKDRLTIDISGKNHYALIAFLRKHGYDKEDIDQFVEEAIVWRMLDREMAMRHDPGAPLFTRPAYADTEEKQAA